jgi:hypothetical protein
MSTKSLLSQQTLPNLLGNNILKQANRFYGENAGVFNFLKAAEMFIELAAFDTVGIWVS